MNTPLAAIFSDVVREDLVAAGCAGGLAKDSPLPEWERHFNRNAGKVLGLALVAPADLLHFQLGRFPRSSRAIRDYFLDWSIYSGFPMQELRVLHVARLREPDIARSSIEQVMRPGLFWQMTRFSCERLLGCTCDTGRAVREVIESWVARGLLDPAAPLDRIMALPTPFAELVIQSQWVELCFPVALTGSGRTGGAGYAFVPSLMPPGPGLQRAATTDTEAVDSCAQLMRRFDDLADALRTHPAAATEEVQENILWLQQRRDHCFRQLAMSSYRQFRMDKMVESVIVGGMSKSASMFRDVVAWAARAAVTDPQLRAAILEQMARPHAFPSPTSLRRHRLTLHMGYCMWQRQLNEALLSKGPCISYRTVDSSPQGGWDWVLHGGRVLPTAALGQALADFHALCDTRGQPEGQQEIVDRLAPLLVMHAGPPTAVGSGKGSLSRKVRAVLHSQRLESESWPSALALLNSAVSWTGDLGTESGIWKFSARLADVFGNWVELPVDAAGEGRGEAVRGDGDFQFVDSAVVAYDGLAEHLAEDADSMVRSGERLQKRTSAVAIECDPRSPPIRSSAVAIGNAAISPLALIIARCLHPPIRSSISRRPCSSRACSTWCPT